MNEDDMIMQLLSEVKQQPQNGVLGDGKLGGSIVYHDSCSFSSSHGTFLPGIEIVSPFEDDRLALDYEQAYALLLWLLQELPCIKEGIQKIQQKLSFGSPVLNREGKKNEKS